MRIGTNRILLILFILLGGYVLLFEAGLREKADEEANILLPFPFSPEEVDSFSVRTAGEAAVTCVREGAEWRIAEPIGARADADAIGGILAVLKSITAEPLAGTSADDLVQFGLDTAGRMSVRVSAGGRSAALHIGRTVPLDVLHAYALVEGRDGVFRVVDQVKAVLGKGADGLRDRAVFRFDSARVDRIRIGGPDGTVLLRKREDSWRVAEPIDTPADPQAVGLLLHAADRARVERFIAKQPDAAPSGSAELTIEIGEEGRTETQVLRLRDAGPGTGDELLLGRTDGTGDPFLIRKDIFAVAPTELAEFRRMQPFTVDPAEAVRIEYTGVSGSIVLESRDDGWFMLSPAETRASEEALRRAFARLGDVEAVGFLPDRMEAAGSGTEPLFSLRIRLRNGKEERFAVYPAASGGAEPGSLVGFSSLMDTPFLLPAELLDALRIDPLLLRDRHLARFPPSAVTELSIRRRSEELLLRKRRGAWFIEHPGRGIMADAQAVLRVVFALRDLEFVEVLEERRGESDGTTPTSPPELTVELICEDGQTVKLLFGEPRADGSLPVTASGLPGRYAVPPGALDAIPGSAEEIRYRR